MAFGIDSLRKHMDQRLEKIEAVLVTLERSVSTMATRAELDAVKTAIVTAISDASSRVSADLQALRDQIAAGNPVTDQDLADLQADVQAIAGIDPAVVPLPPPTP